MTFWSSIASWLQRNRTTVRVAFILRMVAMAAGSIFSLLWYRLLVHAMGKSLNGAFLIFQGMTRLGGVGDLGVSGALALKAGLMLGAGDETGLRKLLASARSLFLFLACALCVVFLALSPWMPRWYHFKSVPGVGSMNFLFLYGGLSLAAMVIAGYFASLNFAHGTVTWPILPSMVLSQALAPFFHWRLALIHAPFWVQNLPYLGASVIMAFLMWRMLKWSHPWLGNLRPVEFDRTQWKTLASASWWTYLMSLGNAIYVTTDRLVIGAGFANGKDIVSTYVPNYKVCDLGVTLILTASFVSLPKITQWISSPQESDRRRLLTELDRLSIFEIASSCIVVLGYLAFNNLFVRVWLGKDFNMPLALQFAFACNLAVTCGGNAGLQLSARTGDRGIKLCGLALGATGLINVTLSILSVKFGSITGVAVATVIAQSIATIFLGVVTCRYLGLSALRWIARCWLLPVLFTVAAAGLKVLFPEDSLFDLGLLSACYLVLLLVVCRLAGLTRELVRTEIKVLSGLFGKS